MMSFIGFVRNGSRGRKLRFERDNKIEKLRFVKN
jgi:hypothetical protein